MKLPRWLINFSAHTMLHNKFPWVVYRPDIHRVRGEQVRKVLDIIRPGDILLRRFDGYLNTIFTPGFWGHAGVKVSGNDVVHAISKGVTREDILNFCRCDAICVLEPYTATLKQRDDAVQKAEELAEKNIPYDFEFSSNNETYYCTELVSVIYNSIFLDDYEEIAGNLILTPDGIRHSRSVRLKLEIKP